MIDPEVIDQANEIRRMGPVNMLDRQGVQYHANEHEFFALVNWIEENPREYMSLLSELGRRG